jgi:hypothetical protein
MSDERLEQEEAKDKEDVEAHKKHSMARNAEATDEPGTADDESDDVEAHARRASHRNL